jgi:hypothetical protein
LAARLKKAMHLPGHLPSDRSYGGAARFLQHLINERKEDFFGDRTSLTLTK